MSTVLIEPSSEQTSRSNLIAAFKRVVKRAGRRRATDLHVRRLLLYVQAKDHDGQGVQRSLEQLAKVLFLNVSTCRRIVRRAVKKFGLLTVISQRHARGGQTANRYSVNWEKVDAILCDEDRENTLVGRSKSQPGSGSAPGSTDMPVRLALLVGSSDLSSITQPFAGRATTSTPAHEVSDMPVRLAIDSHADGPFFADQPPSDPAMFRDYLPPLNPPKWPRRDFSSSTPDALSDQPPKNNVPDSLPVQLGPTTSAPATTDQPPSNLGSCGDSHLHANAIGSPFIAPNNNYDAPALCDHPVGLSNRPPLDSPPMSASPPQADHLGACHHRSTACSFEDA